MLAFNIAFFYFMPLQIRSHWVNQGAAIPFGLQILFSIFYIKCGIKAYKEGAKLGGPIFLVIGCGGILVSIVMGFGALVMGGIRG